MRSGQPPDVTALLDNPRIGVLELDRHGRILEGNDRARSILRHGDGLLDRNGMLRARRPADQVLLERLVGNALPASGAVAVSGSMVLRRSSVAPPFVVHVKPVGIIPHPDYGARHVAALVLIVEPGRHPRINPDLGPKWKSWIKSGLALGRRQRRAAVSGKPAKPNELIKDHALAPNAFVLSDQDRLVGQVYKVSRIELFQVGSLDAPSARFDGGDFSGVDQTADRGFGESCEAGRFLEVKKQLVPQRHGRGGDERLKKC